MKERYCQDCKKPISPQAKRCRPCNARRAWGLGYFKNRRTCEGIPKTEEHKRNLSKAHKGKEFSFMTRLKMSKTHTGMKHSKETREKMSMAQWRGGSKKYYQDVARNTWENYWSRKIQKGFCIHHLDRDIRNNNITNLSCIPEGYHHRYHAFLQHKEWRKLETLNNFI